MDMLPILTREGIQERVRERLAEAERERLLRQISGPRPPFRLRLVRVLRAAADRLDPPPNPVADRAVRALGRET
jgi:hypothetical protein